MLNYAYWPKSNDLYIGGNSLSTEYNYIQIILSKWNGKDYWQSDSEINTALQGLRIGFVVTDYYFDSNDYSNPQKININDQIQFYTLSGMT